MKQLRVNSSFTAAGLAMLLSIAACDEGTGPNGDENRDMDTQLVAQGKDIFRFDTFGDEVYWTDTLRMNEVIATGVSPKTALAVGLKVDSHALPDEVEGGNCGGAGRSDDPATTVALLKMNAVVGVPGTVQTAGGRDRLVRVGITCALCHSTLEFLCAGIGKRLGHTNRTLNIGAIVALSPAVTASLKQS